MEVNIKDLEFIQLSVNTVLMPFHCVDDDLKPFKDAQEAAKQQS